MCPGVSEYALSIDEAQDCDPGLYPLEYIHSITLSGIPDHAVLLKKGAPYLIMHNASPTLCNGTRVIYHRRVGRCLEVEISSGVHKGEFHYLPRLVLTFRNPTMPFTLRRIQFPLMLCWAMTVHKSQGQTLDKVGIYFSAPAWAHGLLYVAVSRVRCTLDCFFVGCVGATVHNFISKHAL
jgi:ATP-dependent DNA helicase PIF1